MDSSKKFGFINVASNITPVPPTDIAHEIQAELISRGATKITEADITLNIPLAFLILTGGTEQHVLDLYLKRKNMFSSEPILLLAHPANNSLPAALEILARIEQDNNKGKIIYLDDKSNKECWHDLERMIKYHEVYHNIKKTKIGLIGNPSEWLIASSPSLTEVENVWGVQIKSIEISELIETINQVTNEEIENEHYSLVKKAVEIKEPSKKELLHVVKVHAGLKKIIAKYELTAVSVRCFDLVTDLKTTGCFALSKLNDEGIIAGCEGDLVSTIGMIWVNYFTDQSVWMANPAQLNEHNNSIWLAHCTIPINMVDNYKLRSHFESGLGVGIQGDVSKGKATLIRLGGKKLEKIWLSNGEILESGYEENLCRTQVHVKLHGSAKPSDLLNQPLGNHMLMVRGNFAKELYNWWEMFIK